MASWTGHVARNRTDQEKRPPTSEELLEKVKKFKLNWFGVLAIHWLVYLSIFFSTLGATYDGTGAQNWLGLFLLLAHQIAYMSSNGWLFTFFKKRIKFSSEMQSVRICERVEVILSLDSSTISANPHEGSGVEISRRVIDENTPARDAADMVALSISLESGQVALDWVRDQDGTAILEIRDKNVHRRIDLTGFDRDADPSSPTIDRDPISLSPEDADELRLALVFNADAHSIKVPHALR